MAQIGRYTIMIIISALLEAAEMYFHSNYLRTFFAQNAILLGGAIFTIHATGTGILMGQITILSVATKFDFSKTITSIQHSFIESFIALGLIILMAILIQGTYFTQNYSNYQYCLNIFICIQVTCVIALFSVVYDTINAIILSFIPKIPIEDKN